MSPSRWPGSADLRARWIAAAAAAVALALLPVCAARPPVLDLAPQFEQVVLAARAWGGERPDLEVDALSANRLGYVPLAAALLVAGPTHGHRLGLALVILLAVLSVHAVAAVRCRSAAAALLASTFVLSSPLYAGFFNFLAGLGAVAFWAWELDERRRNRSPARVALSTLVGATWFFLANVAWLAVGGLWVLATVLVRRDRFREIAARALGLLPVLVWTWFYRSELIANDWEAATRMVVEPLARIGSWRAVAGLAWGGLRDGIEPLLLAAVALWLLAGVLGSRREEGGRVDRLLGLAALVFAVVAILAPDRVDRTVLFARRWGPMAGMLAVLALPVPRLPRLAWLASAGLFVALWVPTAIAWQGFDRDEMRGFDAALDELPEGASVISLTFERVSPRIVVRPYLQMGAYASIEKRARLDFSFTQLGTSLVRERTRSPRQARAMQLLWQPEEVGTQDFEHFDHLLLRGPEPLAAALVAQTGFLARVAGESSWHLLAIDREALARRPPPSPPDRPVAIAAPGSVWSLRP